MKKSPMQMTRQTPRTAAFDQFKDEAKVEKPAQKKSANDEDVKKFKTKLSDYEGVLFKKTTVELPPEMLYRLSVYCATHGISKKAYLLKLIGSDLNKQGA